MSISRAIPIARRLTGRLFALIVPLAALIVLLASFASAGEENPTTPSGEARANDTRGIEFFEERIRPALVAHCYKCHATSSETVQGGLRLDDRRAARKGGDSGPAVVPGNVDESLLMAAIQYTGELFDMPPDGKLPDNVIADFRRWIEMGAADPREPKITEAPSTTIGSTVSRNNLWVLQPLERPQVPSVRNDGWSRDRMDRFVLASLKKQELTPAAAADRYSLLRRVTFDLTGLPPRPEDIESFIHDPSSRAYEGVVERLLASPAFGDHWARHWFDLSCYADLADVQGNVVIRGAWRYRDYVIDALNRDKPFDRFIHEQIAGDLLPYTSLQQQRDQLIATGYLSIGPWALQNYVKEQLQADVVAHQIDKISRTFLGMSTRCAQCHDHKFDPIPTRDYYALAGIFHNTLTTRYDGPGVWSQIVTRQLPEIPGDKQIAAFDMQIAEIKRQQTDLQRQRRAKLDQRAPEDLTTKQASSSANSVTLQTAIPANVAGKTYQVSFAAGPSVWNDPSQATSEDDGILVQLLRADDTVLAYHVHRPGAWSGQQNSQQLSRTSFTYAGDGSGDVRLHIIAHPIHTGRFGGALDNLTIVDTETSHVVLRDDFNAYQSSQVGSQATTQLPVYASGRLPKWDGNGINHSHAVDLGGNQGPRNIALQLFSGSSGTSDNPRVRKIDDQLRQLSDRLRSLEYYRPGLTHALAAQDVPAPKDAAIYIRGNFRTRGEAVPRGFLSTLFDEPSLTIPEGESGRKELAEWLTSDRNPITPRVLANRVWLYLVGAGIVRSVDYFGIHGDSPSHPELLDDLAIQFRDVHQWSLKSLIRQIVLSSTYRMSSSYHDAAAAIDPDNRLLWRMNRRRLMAESIRDGMLAISGRLDYDRGGPSLGLDLPGNVSGIGGDVNPPTYSGRKTPEHVANRRVVYLPLQRKRPTGELELLSIFDFPHPSEITGRRPETTVATQALFLMNAPFVKTQARHTAASLFTRPSVNDDGGRDETLVHRLYLLLLNRPADEEETRQAIDFVNQYQKTRATMPDRPEDIRLEAWTEFCHALFASNEFLFKE